MSAQSDKSNAALKSLDDWCRCITEDESRRYSSALKLKANGDPFSRLGRLYRWLSGDYTADDFEQSVELDEHNAWVERANARQAFLDRVAAADPDISWANSTGNEPHPLEGLITDETVRENFERSRQWVNDTTRRADESGEPSENGEDEAINESAEQTKQGGISMFQMTAPDGTMVEVPTDWAMYMAAMSKKIDSLNESIRELASRTPHPTANSTRMDARETVDRRVTFENTPANHSLERQGPARQQTQQTSNVQRPPPPSTPLSHRQRADEAWGGGGSQNRQWSSTSASEIERQSRGRTPQYSDDLNRTSSGNNRDIGQIVRRWGYKFAGEPGESIDTFLERIEESWELAKLTEFEMLSALPELFVGVAATWVRSNRSAWSTWEQFTRRIRRWCGVTDHVQQRLAHEVALRTQGPEESVRDYITCLEAMMRRMEPAPSTEFQLATLHRNMKPRLQQLVRRNEFQSIETLLDRAMEAELAVEAEKSFKLPPPPEMCVYADLAYKPRKPAPPRIKVAAVETKPPPTRTPQTSPSLEETMAKFAGMILEGIKKIQAPNSAHGAPPHVSRPTTGNENNGAKKKIAPKRHGSKQPKRRQHSSSSSESSGDERGKRSSRKTASSTSPPRGATFHCYGCGAPGVIRRNCAKCAPENAQQTK